MKTCSFVLVLMMLVVLVSAVGLEVGLRLMGIHIPQDPYLSFGTVPEFFIKKKIEGKDYYQVAHREVYSERQTIFSAKKDPGSIRILSFGASASAGWPHPAEEIYSVYLQEAFRQAFPNRQIEVINLAAHAYAAYRVRLIFEEAMQFEPDAVVIWSGNNEFIEKRRYRAMPAWLSTISNLANHSLAYRGLRGSRIGRWMWPENTLSAYERGHHLHTLWSKIEQVALDLRTDPEQFERVTQHYAESVTAMVQLAQQRRIPVILATIPVNLRDWRPVVSCHLGRGQDLARWQEDYHRGLRATFEGEWRMAEQELEQAIALDPDVADVRFDLGHVLVERQDFARAVAQYELARDVDCNPFRALSRFSQIIRDIASRYAHVTLADLEQAFQSTTEPMAPGFDLFLDYVHPSKLGNWVAAKTIFTAIINAGVLGPQHGVPPFTVSQTQDLATAQAYDDWFDVPLQVVLARFCMIQHQYDCVVIRARHLLQRPDLSRRLTEGDRMMLQQAEALFGGFLASREAWIRGERADPTEEHRLKLMEFYRQTFEGYQEYHKQYGVAPS